MGRPVSLGARASRSPCRRRHPRPKGDQLLERVRARGSQVIAGDLFEMEGGGVLWRVEAVRVDGADVELEFAQLPRGRMKTLLRAGERVNVWRRPVEGRP